MESKVHSYRLHGIEIIEKHLLHTNVSDDTQFNFEIKSQSVIDGDRKIAVIVTDVTISKIDENNAIATFVAAFGFEIENFDTDLPKNKDGISVLPIELETVLKSITISTMRGIIFSELRGTSLHKAVMPIIMMDSFKPIKDNLMEKIKSKKK